MNYFAGMCVPYVFTVPCRGQKWVLGSLRTVVLAVNCSLGDEYQIQVLCKSSESSECSYIKPSLQPLI